MGFPELSKAIEDHTVHILQANDSPSLYILVAMTITLYFESAL